MNADEGNGERGSYERQGHDTENVHEGHEGWRGGCQWSVAGGQWLGHWSGGQLLGRRIEPRIAPMPRMRNPVSVKSV
jgi:hypothetical protein